MKKIQVLDYQFKALSISGIWRPIVWTTKTQLILYSLYSFFCCFFMISLGITQFLLFVVTTEVDLEMLSGRLFKMLTSVTTGMKLSTFLFRRKEVIQLADMLSKSCCLPKNKEEEAIQKRGNDFMRIYTILLNVMGHSTVACLIVLPLIFSNDYKNALPVQIWLPRIIWNNIWMAYVFEGLGMFATGFMNMNSDAMVGTFMWNVCIQFDIARHRLEELPRRLRQAATEENASRETLLRIEKESLVLAVQHQKHIIKYAIRVNEVINFMVVVQFFDSCLIIATLVFELSVNRHVGLFVFFSNILYLICMLAQFFTYCWFGNEVTLKCEEFGRDIYRMDWCSLSVPAHRMLMFIVLRTRKPVVLSVGHFVVLNLESFKSILKVSFSAFNFLKDST